MVTKTMPWKCYQLQFLCKKKGLQTGSHVLSVYLRVSLYMYNCVLKPFHWDYISTYIYTQHFCCTLHVKN